MTRTDEAGKSGCSAVFWAMTASFLLCMAGIALLLILGYKAIDRAQILLYDRVPCQIHSATLRVRSSRKDPYEVALVFRFQDGTSLRAGRSWSPGGPLRYSSTIRAYRKIESLMANPARICYVHRRDRSKSYLSTGLFPWILSFLAPLILLSAGISILVSLVRRRRRLPTRPADSAARSRAVDRTPAIMRFLIFLGAVIFLLAALPSYLEWIRSKSWESVPCSIVHSRLHRKETDDGVTYRIDILFRYNRDGRTWYCNRYSFFNLGNSGYWGKSDIVRSYDKGARATCWIDPNHPYRAVLTRRFRATFLVGLLPLLLCAAGYLGLAGRYSRPRLRVGRGALRPTPSRAAALYGIAFMTVFWNGIVSVFLFQWWQQYRHGHPNWFNLAFFSIFIAIGIFFCILLIRQVLVLFNPRPSVTAEPQPVQSGGTLLLTFSIRGGIGHLESLSIHLVGKKRYSRRNARNRRNREEILFTRPVFESRGTTPPVLWSESLRIDRDVHPTGDGDDGSYSTWLHIEGSIPRWPDLDEWYEILIAPEESSTAPM